MRIYVGCFLFLFSFQLSAQSDAIEGKWFAEELDNATIRIEARNGAYFGEIVRSDVADHVGVEVLKNLQFDPEQANWIGTVYSPKRKMNINATVTLESPDKLKIVGKKFVLTKTFYFTKNE